MPKRFIFTYNAYPGPGLTDAVAVLILCRDISQVICTTPVQYVAEDEQLFDAAVNQRRIALDQNNTWFITIWSEYAFELNRDDAHGIAGLEELSKWLAFSRPALTTYI